MRVFGLAFAFCMGVLALVSIPALALTAAVAVIDERLGDPWTFALGLPVIFVGVALFVSGFITVASHRGWV